MYYVNIIGFSGFYLKCFPLTGAHKEEFVYPLLESLLLVLEILLQRKSEMNDNFI